jgi:hypothetical protein
LVQVAGEAYTGGGVSVYRAVDPSTGQVVYVGITDNLVRRAAAHLAEKGIVIDELQPMGKFRELSRWDARCVEQALIEYYGLGKNGGTLMNKINSIASKDRLYAEALRHGRQLLQAAGYVF